MVRPPVALYTHDEAMRPVRVLNTDVDAISTNAYLGNRLATDRSELVNDIDLKV
jgi:hypothetical protein